MKRTPIARKTPLESRSTLRPSLTLRSTSGLRSNSTLRTNAPLRATTPLRSRSTLATNSELARSSGLTTRKTLRAKPGPKATPAQKARWDRLREIGCICCRMNAAHGYQSTPIDPVNNPIEMQHLLSGARRMGHGETVALCHWHHQGKRLVFFDRGYAEQAKLFGPSFGHEPNRFRSLYGREEAQLEYQEALLQLCPPTTTAHSEETDRSPWVISNEEAAYFASEQD